MPQPRRVLPGRGPVGAVLSLAGASRVRKGESMIYYSTIWREVTAMPWWFWLYDVALSVGIVFTVLTVLRVLGGR